ncbi:OmpA family protein [Vibrio metschnikovii]|nr:OmpA family protein [Vibrio metschnikovii]EKO3609985.1 OmpA family protein [Vibrio metschnikovii]EKO3682952.1 OmpA family protein [Vibrio metschnikovii]EKO3738259.1 OmpA family protein [Vibrio metschnikovii]
MKRVCLSLMVLSYPVWSAVNEPQFFVGAKGGYQFAQDDTYQHSKPNGAIMGAYSGVRFSPAWSWDLGYQYHDDLKADATSVNVKTWLIESALRYDWYIKNDLSLYGRVGVAYWDMEKTQFSQHRLDATGFSPLGEVGVNYHFTPNLRLSAGYQYIDSIGDSNTGKYDSHGFLVGLAYSFGSSSLKDTPVVSESILVVEKVEELSPQTFTFSAKNTEDFLGFDSTQLSDDFVQSLREVASVLTSHPQARAIVVGHTDSIGSEAYNQALSERRAQAVVSQLVDLGVSREQLEWRGEGELYPIADNLTADGRAQNRRVEVIIPSFQFQK